jgi:hypothetical protein
MANGALAHPDAMKMIGEVLVAVSVGLAAMGTAAVIGAATMLIPGGGIGAAIIGLAGAMAAIGAINWASIGPGIETAIKGIESQFITAIAGMPGALAGAISGIGCAGLQFIDGVIQRFSN